MNKEHKWIEHHSNVHAKFYKCLRCKRFAFYLDYKGMHTKIHNFEYKEHHTLEQKFMITLQYINDYGSISSSFRTNFFKEYDVKMLNDVVYWNCNELDVKDILT